MNETFTAETPSEEKKSLRTAMISLPMMLRSEEEIRNEYIKATKHVLHDLGYDYVVDTLFNGPEYSVKALEARGIKNIPLYFLAKSLERMAECDTVYFCKGWEEARGCQMEYKAAHDYFLQILFEENDKYVERKW